jgi:hypothetical protein
MNFVASRPNLATTLAICFLALLIIACGGGGGGGTSGTTSGPFSSVRIEAVLSGTETMIDPNNVFPSETVQFRITGIDESVASRPRINLNATGFTLVGSESGGTLTTSGLFAAGSLPGTATGTVQVTYSGSLFTSPVRVVAKDAVLTGLVRLTSGTPAPRVQIRALSSALSVVATGFTAPDGTFRMSLPPTATKFTVNFDTADPTRTFYVRQFAYNAKDYSTSISSCVAPLPALTTGSTTALLTAISVYQLLPNNPPPPPNGCQ